MAQLITLSKLAALVSENTGIELSVCNAFIRNMSQAVAAALAEGEHVRIKNFGLFEARQSPEGDLTVEFVPETAFSEQVNAPFAHLRPTAAPTTKQNSIDPQAPAYTQMTGQQTPTPAVPKQPEFPQAPAYTQMTGQQAPTTAVQQQPEFPQAPAYTQMTGQQAPTTAVPQQPEFPQTPAYTQMTGQPDIPAGAAFPGNQSYPSQDAGLPFQRQDAPHDMASYISLSGIGQSEPDGVSESTSSDTLNRHNPTRSSNRQLPQLSTNKKYVLIGVMGLITGFILGYLVWHNPSSENAPTETAEAIENPANVSPTPASQPVAQEYDYESSVSVADIDPLTEEEETADTPQQPAAAPEAITVKLQKGQRLSDIAQKYYGHKDYWVYIYFENRKSIANPFTIREGTILTIPPKEKYAQTTDETANLQWAKAKGAEINNKYQ